MTSKSRFDAAIELGRVLRTAADRRVVWLVAYRTVRPYLSPAGVAAWARVDALLETADEGESLSLAGASDLLAAWRAAIEGNISALLRLGAQAGEGIPGEVVEFEADLAVLVLTLGAVMASVCEGAGPETSRAMFAVLGQHKKG